MNIQIKTDATTHSRVKALKIKTGLTLARLHQLIYFHGLGAVELKAEELSKNLNSMIKL